jgi:iron complex outermembrane receptor protein
MRITIRSAFMAAVLAVAAAGTAPAQTTGAITGPVRDASGGTVPGATVTVVNEKSRSVVETTSDSQGTYRVADLSPGSYRVHTTLDGFEPAVREVALAIGQRVDLELILEPGRVSDAVVVTARRVEEAAQDVPIPLSVVSRGFVENAGAFNVNRLKELIPTVQFYSTNPRNSAINIRGLGAPFGLTNDGLEPGVGLYVDGVFYSRPAAATLDFLDVDRIEVLRGPQGTLFGKNTTAGAIAVTTRKPSFTKGADVELNLGDLGFVQAKASATGPLGRRVAGRLSFAGTSRGGTVFNVKTEQAVNDLDNAGLRGQLLAAPSDKVALTWTTDYTRQRPEGYTQVVAGVAPTLRPANRQYPQIAADLQYAPPSVDAFDRLTDVDTPLRSYQDLGGSSLNLDWKTRRGVLTATGGWRFWNWNPSNDRDFIGLPVTTVSAAPSRQRQWSEEVRYAGSLAPRVAFVVGGFAFHQTIDSDPSFTQEQGAAAARFLLAPTPAAATPGLLDGYGFTQDVHYDNTSAAIFGQVEVAVTDRLRLLPGLRFNDDQKRVDFDQQVYGGLQTSDPVLVALQLSVLAPQQYKADVGDTNVSGQFTASYRRSGRVNAYATYATGFKSVGLNLNGVPTDARNQPVLSAAVVKPEDVRNVEVGLKTQIMRGVTANVTAYDTEIKNFQTQVTNASVGVLRGYLANAERVRVHGVEVDVNASVHRNASVYGAVACTDGKYVTFVDAPPPLEETGGPSFKDVSGTVLPGISKWALSIGGEYGKSTRLLRRSGHLFGAIDTSYRSAFSSSGSYSRYLVVDGYALVNVRAGFRAADGWTVFVWSRNLLDRNYFELLTAAPGNTGLYVGQPGDGRTAGVTLRLSLGTR